MVIFIFGRQNSYIKECFEDEKWLLFETITWIKNYVENQFIYNESYAVACPCCMLPVKCRPFIILSCLILSLISVDLVLK